MNKWIRSEKKTKKLSQKFRSYTGVFFHKIEAHHYYQAIQSKIGIKKMRLLNICILLLILALVLTHCDRLGNGEKKEKPPSPVVTTKIRKGDVPLYLKSIGTVTPIESIAVRTQINGRITKVNFEEGQIVNKGQVLVEIDPLPYEALLKQYEGQLLRDEALLKNARLDLKRYKRLNAQDSISQQTLDTQIHLVQQYEGTVKSDQGLVDTAKVNLQYCHITSAITGIIGLRFVNPGNFVQTTDTTFISTVTQISPITVVFPLPEDDIGKVQEKIRDHASLITDAFDRHEEKLLASGHFLAMDSQIDNTTGTIKLKATFANDDYRLFPNQFVNIRLKLGVLPNALIVPTAAIQVGREGHFIYVVNEEKKTVSLKLVTVETSEAGQSSVIGDIAEGQVVVIQGTDKLQEGSLVTMTQTNYQESKGSHTP